MRYGIANEAGQIDSQGAKDILDLAIANDVNTLDTAIAYGNSDEILGECSLESLKIITKIPTIPKDCFAVYDWVISEVQTTLKRLNQDSVYGILLHDTDVLFSKHSSEIIRALEDLKKDQVTQKVGLSIYHFEDLESLFSVGNFEILQCPFNILDQRLVNTFWLDKLSTQNVEVHVRSIFLQGLLLMDQKTRPEKFGRWNKIWKDWDEWLKIENLSPLEACLIFAFSHKKIDKIIVGVDSVEHLKQILSIKDKLLPPLPAMDSSDKKTLINPSLWSSL